MPLSFFTLHISWLPTCIHSLRACQLKQKRWTIQAVLGRDGIGFGVLLDVLLGMLPFAVPLGLKLDMLGHACLGSQRSTLAM